MKKQVVPHKFGWDISFEEWRLEVWGLPLYRYSQIGSADNAITSDKDVWQLKQRWCQNKVWMKQLKRMEKSIVSMNICQLLSNAGDSFMENDIVSRIYITYRPKNGSCQLRAQCNIELSLSSTNASNAE